MYTSASMSIKTLPFISLYLHQRTYQPSFSLLYSSKLDFAFVLSNTRSDKTFATSLLSPCLTIIPDLQGPLHCRPPISTTTSYCARPVFLLPSSVVLGSGLISKITLDIPILVLKKNILNPSKSTGIEWLKLAASTTNPADFLLLLYPTLRLCLFHSSTSP